MTQAIAPPLPHLPPNRHQRASAIGSLGSQGKPPFAYLTPNMPLAERLNRIPRFDHEDHPELSALHGFWLLV